MNENFDSMGFEPSTILLIVFAVVIFWRLMSVMGKRTGHEQQRHDQLPRSQGRDSGANGHSREDDNVIPMPGQQPAGPHGETMVDTVDVKERIRKYAAKGSLLEKGLLAIFNADRSFEPDQFLAGAKSAYELIVMAFAEGNRKLLKQLLNREVYDGFAAAISEREKLGNIVESSFVGIDKADIIAAELENRTAHVTVRFVSSLITATHNKDGEVIDGDPKQVREVTDIWTFARELTSRDPNWKLVATEAAA